MFDKALYHICATSCEKNLKSTKVGASKLKHIALNVTKQQLYYCKVATILPNFAPEVADNLTACQLGLLKSRKGE